MARFFQLIVRIPQDEVEFPVIWQLQVGIDVVATRGTREFLVFFSNSCVSTCSDAGILRIRVHEQNHTVSGNFDVLVLEVD